MNEQLSFAFEEKKEEKELSVVIADYKEKINTNWKELFSGYDVLYAITYSAGIDFIKKVIATSNMRKSYLATKGSFQMTFKLFVQHK